MSHINLETYYKKLFALVQYHKWNPEWVENLIPWELDVLCELMKQHLEEEKANQLKQQQQFK